VTGDPPNGAPSPDADPEAAWAELRARWGDEEAHRAFLSRANDLDALAGAGARYREVLASDPGDAAALRGRDEVLRKATVLGLAAVPRTTPPSPMSPWVKRGVLAGAGVALLGLAAWTALALLRSGAIR
jgi:ferric-dicitrate binding protein FerR (iron transport regulator)